MPPLGVAAAARRFGPGSLRIPALPVLGGHPFERSKGCRLHRRCTARPAGILQPEEPGIGFRGETADRPLQATLLDEPRRHGALDVRGVRGECFGPAADVEVTVLDMSGAHWCAGPRSPFDWADDRESATRPCRQPSTSAPRPARTSSGAARPR